MYEFNCFGSKICVSVNIDSNFKIILKFYHFLPPSWLPSYKSQQFLPQLLPKLIVSFHIYSKIHLLITQQLELTSFFSNTLENSHHTLNATQLLTIIPPQRIVLLDFQYEDLFSILCPLLIFILFHRLYHHLKLLFIHVFSYFMQFPLERRLTEDNNNSFLAHDSIAKAHVFSRRINSIVPMFLYWQKTHLLC